MDRFGPGDPRAESGGETRLLRFSHGADVLYTRLARRARELWLELGGGVLVESGVAWLARRADGWEAESERVLRAEGIPVERLAPEEALRLLPGLSPDGLAHVLHEPEAGVLHAARGVRALAARAPARRGARGDRPGRCPRAARSGSASACSRPTPWSGPAAPGSAGLFPELVRLRVTLQQLALFEAGPEWAGPGWVDFDGPWYGHAAIEPHGFKVAHDADGPPADPDARPLEAGEDAVRTARGYLAERFPGLAEAPVASAPACHYSLTPDSNFLFARHPGRAGRLAARRRVGPRLQARARGGRARGGRARRDAPSPSLASRSVSGRPGRKLRTAGSSVHGGERAPPPAAAGARHRGHAGLDRRARAAARGDRPGVRRLARRGGARALRARRHGRGGVARDRAGHRPLGGRAADRRPAARWRCSARGWRPRPPRCRGSTSPAWWPGPAWRARSRRASRAWPPTSAASAWSGRWAGWWAPRRPPGSWARR